MTKATPLLPWSPDPEGAIATAIENGAGDPVCYVYGPRHSDTADFVCRAVNNHDALVAALADAIEKLEYLAPEKFDSDEHEAAWEAGLAYYRETLTNATAP